MADNEVATSEDVGFTVVEKEGSKDKWYNVFAHCATIFNAIVDKEIESTADIRMAFLTAIAGGYVAGATVVDKRDQAGKKAYRVLGLRVL